jgi:hypothetical protein
MKLFELKLRLIAPLVVVCCLAGVGSQVAQAQSPTSGALLTINGTVSEGDNNMNVSLTISDKDIHSGHFKTVPTGFPSTCIGADQISTDAYVLQAGAPTGCDPGDLFEGNVADGFAVLSAESTVSYSFGVSTHYQCGADNGGICNAGSISNSRGTINSNDTGFMTVSNNGSSSFTGTITLAASSPSCGLVFDRFTGTLPAHGEINAVLALAQDSSGCGGFSSLSQTQTLEPGVTSIYQAGADLHKVTPINNLGGESLTVTLVPVLQSDFDGEEGGNRPAAFRTESCIPFKDLTDAAGGVHTCGEWQSFCTQGTASANDCSTIIAVIVEDYNLPSDLPAIGGPDFLLKHNVGCPPPNNDFDMSIFLAYSVNPFDPGTKGSGGPSCYVVTYTPGAPLITSGTTSRFDGWEPPVSNTKLNQVKAGSVRRLKFQLFDNLGNPVTTLSLCKSFSGNVCLDSPTVPTPWVNLSSFGIACPDGTASSSETNETALSSADNSGLLNHGHGNYVFRWKTEKDWKGLCANVTATFSFGLAVVPATKGFHFNSEGNDEEE